MKMEVTKDNALFATGLIKIPHVEVQYLEGCSGYVCIQGVTVT